MEIVSESLIGIVVPAFKVTTDGSRGGGGAVLGIADGYGGVFCVGARAGTGLELWLLGVAAPFEGRDCASF